MGDVACQSCGNMVRGNAKFCPRCGNQVSAWTPPSAVEQQPYPQQQQQQPYPQQQPYQQPPQQPYEQPYQQQPPFQQPYEQQPYQQSYYQQQQQPYYGAAPQQYGYGVPADVGTRFLGILIDAIPILIITSIFWVSPFLFWIPVFGLMMVGLLGGAYWLLRDIKGASLGKMAMGTRVFSKSGGEASTQSLIMRNLPIAAPYALLLIPFVGYFIYGPVAFIVGIVELVMYFTQGERLGDKIANTIVLKIK